MGPRRSRNSTSSQGGGGGEKSAKLVIRNTFLELFDDTPADGPSHRPRAQTDDLHRNRAPRKVSYNGPPPASSAAAAASWPPVGPPMPMPGMPGMPPFMPGLEAYGHPPPMPPMMMPPMHGGVPPPQWGWGWGMYPPAGIQGASPYGGYCQSAAPDFASHVVGGSRNVVGGSAAAAATAGKGWGKGDKKGTASNSAAVQTQEKAASKAAAKGAAKAASKAAAKAAPAAAATEEAKGKAKAKEKEKEKEKEAAPAAPPPPPVDGTTVMLRNIPNRYTQGSLLSLIDDNGFKGSYDFVYLPMDFRNGVNLGYAFVNLLKHEDALKLMEFFQGFSRWSFDSVKVCEVSWAHPHQGLEEHIERYKNSPVMHPTMPDDYKPMVFKDGVRTSFPKPTKAIRAPKLRPNSEPKSDEVPAPVEPPAPSPAG
mmetsp:Transcript_47485/g.101574  ORF Transcript_47485/g.101574 Transcript_47485/m.101574 type:complete len:423 (+) Transcript_47485:100-1368(+)